MPRTKVAIRARIEHLNEQLQQRKATHASQQDERRSLVQDCDNNGGHVFKPVYGLSGGSIGVDSQVCEFCTAMNGASREQIRRNLTRA